MIDKIFGTLGGGDVMTGMKYSIFAFMGIIGLIAVIALLNIWKNHDADKKKSSVSLTSRVAVKKKEERRKGVFNYDLLNKSKSSDVEHPALDSSAQQRIQRPKPHTKVSIPVAPHEEVNGVSLKKTDAPRVDMHKATTTHHSTVGRHAAVRHDNNPFASPVEPSALRKNDNHE